MRCNARIPLSKDSHSYTYCSLEAGHEGLHGAQLPIAHEWFDYDQAKGLIVNSQRFQKVKGG